MTTPFQVDLARLDQIVAQLSGLAGFIHDHLDELDHRVADLHAGAWTGAAAAAHADAHRRWTDAAREFATGVGDLSTAAREAHTAYSTAAHTNTRMLRG